MSLAIFEGKRWWQQAFYDRDRRSGDICPYHSLERRRVGESRSELHQRHERKLLRDDAHLTAAQDRLILSHDLFLWHLARGDTRGYDRTE